VLYWQLVRLGIPCDVVAPTLVPVKAGDRVKTDRRDAVKLARCYRAGDLTPVWVPDPAHEALRDLVRAREAAQRDRLRARHRVAKFLLRQGRRPPAGVKPWTQKHRTWVQGVAFVHAAHRVTLLDYVGELDHASARVARLEQAIDAAVATASPRLQAVIAGLQALRGIATVSAVTLVAELGLLSRFRRPRLLMGYGGLGAREHSSGTRVRHGAITKTGNAHVRRIVVEAGWAYRHAPALRGKLQQRQAGLSSPVREIAWKAQHRLHQRWRQLLGRGKPKPQVITAIGRELLGFIWAIGVQVEQETRAADQRAA
jgi:transposase